MIKPKNFEDAMQRLEKLVEQLEGGSLPLEKSIEKYEEGVSLTHYCTELLDKYELKVQEISQSGSAKKNSAGRKK